MSLERKQKLYSIPGTGVETFSKSFVNGDLLTGDVLVVEHHMDVEFPAVEVFDGSKNRVDPSLYTVNCPDGEKVVLDFTGLTPLAGMWHVRVIGG